MRILHLLNIKNKEKMAISLILLLVTWYLEDIKRISTNIALAITIAITIANVLI